MDKNTRTTLAVGMTTGYVIGRTKKGKLALGLLSIAAGRSLDPTALLGQGLRKLAKSPQFAELGDHLRRELIDTGRAAVKDRATGSVTALSEALRKRTEALLTPEDEEQGDGEEAEDEDEEEEEPEEEAEEPRSRQPKEPKEPRQPGKRERRTRAPQGGRSKPTRSRESSASSRTPSGSGRGAKPTGSADRGESKSSKSRAAKAKSGGTRRAGGDEE